MPQSRIWSHSIQKCEEIPRTRRYSVTAKVTTNRTMLGIRGLSEAISSLIVS